MKLAKKLGVGLLAASTVATLAACNNKDDAVSIVIGVQQTSGNNYESMKNLLDSLKEELNFTYKTLLLDSRNNDKNLTSFQNEMLTGVNGIISMVDMDEANTTKLLTECEKNDVYYAGYMTDFANNNQNQTTMNSKYMLGSVSDGEIDGAVRGEYLFNAVKSSTNRNIVFTRFPLYAYPSAADAIDRFKELAEEYNKDHTDRFTFYSQNDGIYEVGFTTSQVPDAEVTNWKNAGVDAVVSVNSLAKRILPTLTTLNLKNSMSIYSTGWDDAIIDDFGDDKCIKTLAQTPAETIIYPLIRVINAARGNSYSDEPTWNNKIATGRYTYVSSTQDLTDGRQNSMNFSTDHAVSRSLIDAAGVKALLAGEKDATYKKLIDTLNSWDSEFCLRRK